MYPINFLSQQTSTSKQVKPRDQNANTVGRGKGNSTVRTSQPIKSSKVKPSSKAQQTKTKAKPDTLVKSRINTAEITSKAAVEKIQITTNEPNIAPKEQKTSIIPISNVTLPDNDSMAFNAADKDPSIAEPISYIADQQKSPLVATINDDNLIKSIKMHTNDSSDNQAMMGKLLNEKWKKDLGTTSSLLLC